MLLARLNDLPLSLSYIQAALELLAHGRILGVEAGRQASEAHVLEIGTSLARRAGSECTRGVDDVVGEVESLWTVTGSGGHVW